MLVPLKAWAALGTSAGWFSLLASPLIVLLPDYGTRSEMLHARTTSGRNSARDLARRTERTELNVNLPY